jgi:hypothetical protein
LIPSETAFLQVAQRYLAVGSQVSQAYEAEQQKLRLELVLTIERFRSPQGIADSLRALAHLTALTNAHRQAFGKFMLAAGSDLNAALAEMPQDLQQAHREGLVSSIQWQLDAQGRFYGIRERWIAAATELCHRVEAGREGLRFGEAGLEFADDGDAARFNALVEIVDTAHAEEVALLETRLTRLAAAASLLGLRPTG